MSIVVLGSNGYIGRYLSASLKAAGHYVIPVNRSVCTLENHDSVRNFLNEHLPEVIVNCATLGGNEAVDEVDTHTLRNNLAIFMNFVNNRDKFLKFINIGSGAEFDRTRDILNFKEKRILTSDPISSYGQGKNIISRMCLELDNFYTLRLFGCFDHSEPHFRLFQKMKRSKDPITISDKMFDMMSLSDFSKIVEYACLKNVPKDMNCVYKEKFSLYEIAQKFKVIHKLKLDILLGQPGLHYTGCSDKLDATIALGSLELEGLLKGIKRYGK